MALPIYEAAPGPELHLVAPESCQVVPDARRKPFTSDEKYVSMLRRTIAGYGVRIAGGDPEDLAVALQVAAELDQVISASVRAMRASSGCTWAEIGRALGMTRQSAQERFGN